RSIIAALGLMKPDRAPRKVELDVELLQEIFAEQHGDSVAALAPRRHEHAHALVFRFADRELVDQGEFDVGLAADTVYAASRPMQFESQLERRGARHDGARGSGVELDSHPLAVHRAVNEELIALEVHWPLRDSVEIAVGFGRGKAAHENAGDRDYEDRRSAL